MSLLLGIDLGTSSLKSLIIDEHGREIALCAMDYQFATPFNGYAEHDPKEWWDAAVKTVREALSKSGSKAEDIAALSFSGQMHGLVALDKDYNVIRPSILHCDARSAEQVACVREKFGPEKVSELMMNPVYSGFLLISLLWVRDNEPENYKKIAHVCLPKDYLKYRLTGVLSCDYSDASATLAFDVKNVKWSEKILTELDIPAEIFPPCFDTCDVVGAVTAEAAAETGLKEGTKVVAGGGDQVMQGIGNGVIRPGDAIVNIGTSGQVSFQSDAPIVNPALSTNTFCGYAKGHWIVMGAIMNAGLCRKWCRSLMDSKTPYGEIDEAVKRVAPGSGGVIFFPYLNGERTPHLNPDLSGAFIGVNLKTGSAELSRAVMEGVCFALRECIDLCGSMGLKPGSFLTASGGGSRSLVWLQIQADIFNYPMRVTMSDEQACLGAAMAAGVGAGIFANLEEAAREVVRYKDLEVEPDAEKHSIYEEYYALYRELFRSQEKALNSLTLLGRRVEKIYNT
ncbi:MAG: xylulokinase [Lachnospiraceae bacterium]|nr:xylulokinase [Lachnospiraceae bacterium]